MNKKEFLEQLRNELRFFPPEEIEDAIDYYDEYISESADEETALWELGSPKRVAEELKKEYYNKSGSSNTLPAITAREGNRGSDNQKEGSVWLYVLIVVLALGFGIPVLNLISGWFSAVTPLLLLVIAAIILVKVLRNKSRGYEERGEYIQTCSDIARLDINLGAGKYVIEQGNAFKIDGGNFKSYISGGTWYISDNISGGIGANQRITTITVPEYFTAESAKIRLGAGNLLIKKLSAYMMSLEVSAGNMEASDIYAKGLNMKCGVGRMKVGASMHGDVTVNCGIGDVSLKLTNREDSFSRNISVGLGKVSVGGQEISGNGKSAYNNGAPYNMNVKCGVGNVKIEFGGAVA
ncbi:MAG: DUF1700 domain-containing protein [Oscillospiraceae bacterium]|nr:DUF1700 domain-containing protein [Oscillospiraceae bacterium]